MISSYKILFSAEILHDYYKDGRCLDFKIYPSPETETLLKNCQLIYKVALNRLLVLSRVVTDGPDAGKPLPGIPALAAFVFYMELIRPEFMIVTNLGDINLRRQKLYFTNISGNKSENTLNLSAAVSEYNGGESYVPGRMVSDSGSIFENIKTSTGTGTGNTDYWLARGKVQYVSQDDALAVTGPFPVFTVQATGTFHIQIFGLDAGSNEYNTLLAEQIQSLDGMNISDTVKVDLSSFKKGKYRISINGTSFPVYLDPGLEAGSVLGVIEIFTHPAPGDPYALIDGDGKVREPHYTIRFANRIAYWKYITPRTQVKNFRIKGSNPAVYPFDHFSTDPMVPARKDYFISKQPLPLSENKTLNNFEIELANPASSDFPHAPKPDPHVPGLLTRSEQDYYCTIYLNY